jgi:hypothetical protein
MWENYNMIQFVRINFLLLSRDLGAMPKKWMDDRALVDFWHLCHSYHPNRKNSNLFSGFV